MPIARLLFVALALAAVQAGCGVTARAAPAAARIIPAAAVKVAGEAFVLPDRHGGVLPLRRLAGTMIAMTGDDGEPMTLRIDAAAPSAEDPAVPLLTLSVRYGGSTDWEPYCDPDAYGRAAGFPVAGAWDDHGRFIRDRARWSVVCASGSRGKCVLWGYNPWGKGPHGEDLVPYYETCQRLVRADYDGSGQAHTKNGTPVAVKDILGLKTSVGPKDGAFAFEAGWGPDGAVCVARTRWPDLLSRETLLQAAPRLAGPCDEAMARRKGALIFTRVKIR